MGLIWKYDSDEPKGALIFLKGGGLEESKGGGSIVYNIIRGGSPSFSPLKGKGGYSKMHHYFLDFK